MRRRWTGMLEASSSPMVTVPPSANAKPAMTRKSVVFPEPDGPNRATSSPPATASDTPRNAGATPNDSRTSLMVSARLSPRGACSWLEPRGACSWLEPLGSAMSAARHGAEAPLDDVLHHQRHQRQQNQQRSQAEGCDPVVLVVEDLDLQRDRVGQAADVAGH